MPVDLLEVERLAVRVGRAWDRLGECEDEFNEHGSGTACGGYRDALDAAIEALIRAADWDLFVARERRRRAAWAARPADGEGP